MNAPEPIIELRGVEVVHPSAQGRVVLGPLDWEVRTGEAWVIGGFQGTGKSVLLSTIAGVNPCAGGEIRLLGVDARTARGEALASLRCRMGIVFPGTGRMLPSLSVLENVALPVQYHRNLGLEAAAEVVAPLMEATELGRVAGVAAGRLPSAWAHRVALARALALKPGLLILDDPLAALDPMHLRWWRRTLQSLRSGHPWLDGQPVTLVMACDELRPLLSVGDRFAVIDGSRLRVLGDRSAVEDSTDPVVRELSGAEP